MVRLATRNRYCRYEQQPHGVCRSQPCAAAPQVATQSPAISGASFRLAIPQGLGLTWRAPEIPYLTVQYKYICIVQQHLSTYLLSHKLSSLSHRRILFMHQWSHVPTYPTSSALHKSVQCRLRCMEAIVRCSAVCRQARNGLHCNVHRCRLPEVRTHSACTAAVHTVYKIYQALKRVRMQSAYFPVQSAAPNTREHCSIGMFRPTLALHCRVSQYMINYTSTPHSIATRLDLP